MTGYAREYVDEFANDGVKDGVGRVGASKAHGVSRGASIMRVSCGQSCVVRALHAGMRSALFWWDGKRVAVQCSVAAQCCSASNDLCYLGHLYECEV
ncbi:hypothetical protein B0G76_5644 [Paraburkholderia sp. BL23I1N1]|nr:hypothetical protein B0G76_5644 [Paraburkholderia sp. BL23I1N1]